MSVINNNHSCCYVQNYKIIPYYKKEIIRNSRVQTSKDQSAKRVNRKLNHYMLDTY